MWNAPPPSTCTVMSDAPDLRERAGEALARRLADRAVGLHLDPLPDHLREVFRTPERPVDAGAADLQRVAVGDQVLHLERGLHRVRHGRALLEADPALLRHRVAAGAIDEQPQHPALRARARTPARPARSPSARTSGSTSASARDTTSCRWVLSAMVSPRNEKSGHGAHFSRCCRFEKCRRVAYHVGPRRRKANGSGLPRKRPDFRHILHGGTSGGSELQGRLRPGDDAGDVRVLALLGGVGRSAFSRFRCSRFSAFSRCFCWRASSFRRLVAPGAAMANLPVIEGLFTCPVRPAPVKRFGPGSAPEGEVTVERRHGLPLPGAAATTDLSGRVPC